MVELDRRTRRWLVVVIGVATALARQNPACSMSRAVVDQETDLQVGNLQRTYHLHVPSSYDGITRTPLVLVFHGLLETSQEMVEMTGLSELADQTGFVVVYPDSIGRHWNDGRGQTALAPRDVDDVGFVKALLRHLETTLAIDSTRVYATGMSNGDVRAAIGL